MPNKILLHFKNTTAANRDNNTLYDRAYANIYYDLRHSRMMQRYCVAVSKDQYPALAITLPENGDVNRALYEIVHSLGEEARTHPFNSIIPRVGIKAEDITRIRLPDGTAIMDKAAEAKFAALLEKTTPPRVKHSATAVTR